MKQWLWEAHAHRVMGMYEPAQAAATKNLDAALALLAAAKGKIAQVDLEEEKARTLRVQAERKLAAGDLAAAQGLVAELEKMASSSASVNVQRTYHGAAGTVLVEQRQYADAISHLEEDLANPLSMKMLIRAYRETGAVQEAATTTQRLREWKVPSIEEALVGDASERPGVIAGQN